MDVKKIEKYIEYGQTKVKTYFKEKKFSNNGYKIKYMLEKNDSDKLVVIFSGFTRIGIKARYNYNRSLKDIKVNKLFILDDFGYDSRGAYYLGHDMDFMIEESVQSLIEHIQKELSVKQTLYVGSSKGGYAAIYFGVKDKNSIIISGAPQYKLGNYLNLNDYMRENSLQYVIGKDVTEEKIELLNMLMKNRLFECKDNNNSLINLHYSTEEHTYKNDIKFLLEDLNEYGYKVKSDVGSYTDHMEVSLHFPKYLVETVSKYV